MGDEMDKVILNATDYVGVTFWVVSLALIAASFFFFVERDRATNKWKTTLSLAAIITGIAAIHYHYIREIWLISGYSPTAYRYIEWLLTGPLQILALYCFIKACNTVKSDLMWRLFMAATIMWLAAYFGEIHYLDEHMLWGCFFIHVIAWLYLLFELFAGEASTIMATQQPATQKVYRSLCWIIGLGWAIYPLGYLYQYGYDGNILTLNVIYNLAELINKVLFGLLIWSVATKTNPSRT
jgi:bacteriorhodopsin